MNEQEIKEREYLLNVSQYKLPKYNPFKLLMDDEKELFVVAHPDIPYGNEMDKITQYGTLFDSMMDLAVKINISLQMAIENTYSDEVLNQFSVINNGGENECRAYFHIENALFRVEALWDILAQICNVRYSLGEKIKKVYHTRIFSKKENWIKKYWISGMPEEVEKIADYLTEEDNTDIYDGMWEGNYIFVNNLRNDMTHKFAISKSFLSSYASEIRHHPSYILKRVGECFSVLQDFINVVLENITEEIDGFENLNKLYRGEI